MLLDHFWMMIELPAKSEVVHKLENGRSAAWNKNLYYAMGFEVKEENTRGSRLSQGQTLCFFDTLSSSEKRFVGISRIAKK